jgi:hypothetical protein
MALLFDAVVLIAVLVAYSFDPSPRHLANGFAPEWDCAAIPKGDPVCIKRPTTAPIAPAN